MKPPRAVLGMFKKTAPLAPVEWLPAGFEYPRLATNIASVPGQPGIYALWHRGVRPQWLRVGAVKHLASAFTEMTKAPDIAGLGVDVYVTWAMPPAADHAGIIRFLAENLRPALQRGACTWDATVDPEAAVITFPLPPGSTL